MVFLNSFNWYGILAASLILVAYLLYRAALPHPIPHIPYKKESAARLSGDLPDVAKWQAENGDVSGFLAHRVTELDSAISQIFFRPFERPRVILCDSREAHDIMTRRHKEFDRSRLAVQCFAGLGSHMHMHMLTGDEWNCHRRLVNDAMSKHFLHEVAGPQTWLAMETMIKLWQQKARLADGRPFDATMDMDVSTFDIIWAATFGENIHTGKDHVKQLAKIQSLGLRNDVDATVEFPKVDQSAIYTTFMTLWNSMDIPLSSPFPILHHWLALRWYPRLRAADKKKTRLILSKLHEAEDKFSVKPIDNLESKANMKSVVELIVATEMKLAAKEGRAPAVDSKTMQDELLGFIIAGHETMSTTQCWALKLLTTHQASQIKLRDTLQSHYGGRRMPSVPEIINADTPYLSAVLEECNRCGMTASNIGRVAITDAIVLGHRIPKGTEIFMLNDGPGKWMKAIDVDEQQRSQSSQAAKGKIPMWDDATADEFLPERWLRTDEDGAVKFNPLAGWAHPFGGGPRGCFGRKWAMLEFKIIITLLVLNFEFLPTPSALSSYAALEKLTRKPKMFYVKLKALG